LETTSNDSEEYLSSHFSLYLCHESAARHNSSAGMSQQWVYFCNSINFPIFHKALDFFCSSALSLRKFIEAKFFIKVFVIPEIELIIISQH